MAATPTDTILEWGRASQGRVGHSGYIGFEKCKEMMLMLRDSLGVSLNTRSPFPLILLTLNPEYLRRSCKSSSKVCLFTFFVVQEQSLSVLTLRQEEES